MTLVHKPTIFATDHHNKGDVYAIFEHDAVLGHTTFHAVFFDIASAESYVLGYRSPGRILEVEPLEDWQAFWTTKDHLQIAMDEQEG